MESAIETAAPPNRVLEHASTPGPLLRPLCWESVAVPELRVQALALASRLAGALKYAPGLAELTRRLFLPIDAIDPLELPIADQRSAPNF